MVAGCRNNYAVMFRVTKVSLDASLGQVIYAWSLINDVYFSEAQVYLLLQDPIQNSLWYFAHLSIILHLFLF